MEDDPDVATLIAGLVTESESAKKYAVFKLQGLLSDPSFADAFVDADGLLPLRHTVLETTGNTQAYALGSLDALLELDKGWDVVDGAVIERAVELAVSHPLVNIVRKALRLLVLVVSRPQRSGSGSTEAFGFGAIKTALENHPTFLESLVQRLSASDHTLCANALQLVNALMRDAVANGGQHEWPKFIKRLQDLGVIGGVGKLMRGDAASDLSTPLASAILEFQGLTKVLLRKWKEVRVNVERAEHKRALKTIHLLSRPEPYIPPDIDSAVEGGKSGRRHHPGKWRRLGFETESPAWEFDETGYLGMMDLVDFARRNEDVYHKTLMEQSAQPRSHRCPIAKASLSTTLILFEHFEIDETADVDEQGYRYSAHSSIHGHGNVDKLYRPLLLQWGRLHTAGVNAFMRLWKVAGAETDDFYKIEEVVRIIVERIVGAASRKTDVGKVEEELRSVSLETARRWQIEGLDEVYEDAWGPHLVQVREQLHNESMQFMKEQRVRCLLQGSWFPTTDPSQGLENVAWRYVRLSHNRRWLHYQDYPSKGDYEPALTALSEKLDLKTVTSVDSDVSTFEVSPPRALVNGSKRNSETLKKSTMADADYLKAGESNTSITITLSGMLQHSKSQLSLGSSVTNGVDKAILLELFPQTSNTASEWLDGLLMLLNQQPITKNTTSLVEMMQDWGTRLRMLNLRWEDVDWEALEMRVKGMKVEAREVPSREGLEGEDYWYAMPET